MNTRIPRHEIIQMTRTDPLGVRLRFVAGGRHERLRYFALLAGVIVSACGRTTGDVGDAKAAASAGSIDSLRAASAVLFSAEQVRHGGVRWESAESTHMAATVEVPGQLVSNGDRTARLSAPAQGRVITVHVRLGERVARGQALVTLQSQEASAARADYSKALAESNSRRAAASFARGARERAERLLAAKAIARQEVERAVADDELAQSAVAQAEAEVERARSTLDQLGVSSTTGAMILRAPLAGIVLSREAAPGSVVDPGTPLVTVSEPATLWLEIAATDRVATALRPGARVRFNVPTFPSDTFQARVQSVGGALDPTTRTLLVRALVQNDARTLRPEMFATVWIEGGAMQAGIVVPDSAVQLLDQKPVVFVAQPDGKGGARLERRDVEIGAKIGGRTQIVRGLKAGDLVVVGGAFAVKSEFSRAKMSEG
ncbi:MAG: efflux RND transporter periplasmic adaptor subunit [Gemmatimonadaceae bacterium]